MTTYIYSDELYHYGVKGQKWGIRNYQYKDMSLTPEGYIHYGIGQPGQRKTENPNSLGYILKKNSNQLASDIRAKYGIINSKKHDTYLNSDTKFYRIQTADRFENFPFYATYKDQDINKYAGLYSRSLTRRVKHDTEKALKDAKATGDYTDYNEKKNYSDNMKIYQLEITNTSKLRIPSEQNVASITNKLLEDKDFHDNLIESMEFAKSQMKRPSQQLLFSEAMTAMQKYDPPLNARQSNSVYKALNLTLTYHNDFDLKVQDKFYGELKKKGYSAIPDLNDKYYSTYHAKSPVIVFDMGQVKLNSVSALDPKLADEYYKKYHRERIAREAIEQTLGTVTKFGSYSVNQASQYVDDKVDEYLNSK